MDRAVAWRIAFQGGRQSRHRLPGPTPIGVGRAEEAEEADEVPPLASLLPLDADPPLPPAVDDSPPSSPPPPPPLPPSLVFLPPCPLLFFGEGVDALAALPDLLL